MFKHADFAWENPQTNSCRGLTPLFSLSEKLISINRHLIIIRAAFYQKL